MEFKKKPDIQLFAYLVFKSLKPHYFFRLNHISNIGCFRDINKVKWGVTVMFNASKYYTLY